VVASGACGACGAEALYEVRLAGADQAEHATEQHAVAARVRDAAACIDARRCWPGTHQHGIETLAGQHVERLLPICATRTNTPARLSRSTASSWLIGLS
jgi:hypothetical protein